MDAETLKLVEHVETFDPDGPVPTKKVHKDTVISALGLAATVRDQAAVIYRIEALVAEWNTLPPQTAAYAYAERLESRLKGID